MIRDILYIKKIIRLIELILQLTLATPVTDPVRVTHAAWTETQSFLTD